MQEQLSFDSSTPTDVASRPSVAPPPAATAPAMHEPGAAVGTDGARAVVATDGARAVVYTDGACSGNPGPGGWAWAIPGGAWARGASPDSTNQRMELQAVLEAVRSIAGPLQVVSDSTYVVNCFRDKWWAGWRRRNWRNSQNKPVANRDLWEPLIDEVLGRDVTFRWVKGHGTDPINGYVDRLAVESARTQTDASAPAGAPRH